MKEHHASAPRAGKFFTPGVLVLLGVAGMGLVAGFNRLLCGLGATTNLDNQHPWGIWIAIDVATGVALAAGGFTTAALTHVFHRRRYEAVVRPALLTAVLGYSFVVFGLMMDLGRYYNIWHPAWPTMWQGNSVLFEVAMCVMVYLTVLYMEFAPIVCERFAGKVRLPGFLGELDSVVEGVLRLSERVLDKVMFALILAGVVLSCMHQSSLGALMLIAPQKMNPLWYTPILPLLFLLSAIAVGYPMVVFESMVASWSFNRKPEMDVLAPLGRLTVVILGIYGVAKVCDVTIREAYVNLFNGSAGNWMFGMEMGLGVLAPFLMLLSVRVRRSPVLLFTASLLIVLGVALNRVNVFLVAYAPPYAVASYFPSIWEILVTAGFVAGLMLMYRVLVAIFPVLSDQSRSGAVRGRIASAILLMGLLGCCGLFARGASAAEATRTPPNMSGDCAACHSSEAPSKDDLVIGRCGRHTKPAPALGAAAAPDFFILDQLSELYVPVVFPHRLHAEMEGMGAGCAVCHHNSPGGEIRACNTCHNTTPDPDNLQQPGLKGAYHRQCLGCHREWSHETACVFCHAKRTPGEVIESKEDVSDITGKLHPNVTTPDKWVYETPGLEEGTMVTFHHKDHGELFGLRCVDCHIKENCSRCHDGNGGNGKKVRQDPHEDCAKCHDAAGDCAQCHMKEESPGFDHGKRSGFMLRPFHHGVACTKCHPNRNVFSGLKRECWSCHAPGWSPAGAFDHAKTGVLALDETHAEVECSGCHEDGMGKPVKCGTCHDEDWKYPERAPGTILSGEKEAAAPPGAPARQTS